MTSRRLIITTVQLIFLCAAAFLIYRYVYKPPVPAELTKEDEEMEEHSITNVTVIQGRIAQQTLRAYVTLFGTVQLTGASHAILRINIPAADLPQLHVGQQAQINLSSNNNAPLQSTIRQISRASDPQTGMFTADLDPPSDAHLLPGTFFRARVITDEHPDCLTVPADAVVHNQLDQSAIALVDETGFAYLVPVEVGLRDGPLVEIRGKDLHAGQPIVTTGAYALTQSSRIHVQSD